VFEIAFDRSATDEVSARRELRGEEVRVLKPRSTP
jgi:hypothetical protein